MAFARWIWKGIVKNNVILVKPDSIQDEMCVIEDVLRPNEQLANAAGLSLLRCFILEATPETNEEKIDDFSKEFLFAEVNHGGGYLACFTRTLFYSDALNIHNIPLLEQVFFDIECIHELRCKLDRYESSVAK